MNLDALVKKLLPNINDTTQQPNGFEDPLDTSAMHATHMRNADSHSKNYWQQANQD